MSRTTELHVQAAVWTERGEQFAALFMQGEAPDKSTGDQSRADALLQAVRARGLPMTTDPDQVSLRPVKGWGVRLTPSGGITLKWPRLDPLLRDAPVELPDGWLNAARTHGIVLVFVGSGLGLHEHAGDGDAHPGSILQRVAEDGCLSGAAVACTDSAAAEPLDGTIGRPHHAGQHRPTALGHRRRSNERWWVRAIHQHAQRSSSESIALVKASGSSSWG